MTVLVTGGGGFLGRAIVTRLLAEGQQVRSLSRGVYPELAAQGVELVQGDLADEAVIQRACRGCESVFHAAAKAGIWGSWQAYWRANVLGTENVLRACRTQGVRRLVYTSSPSVVFNGRDLPNADESVPYPVRYHAHYPHSKALAEQAVLSAADGQLSTVALRPHLIWGPGDPHLVPRILLRARRLRIVGSGTNLVDATYIDNAADAHLRAWERLAPDSRLAGRAYFISNGEPMPLWALVNAILAAGGLPPVTRRISHVRARALGVVLEHTWRWLRLPGEPPMTRFVADELATEHWFDLTAARRDLEYRPRISTVEGLKHLRAWLRGRDVGAAETMTV